MRISFPEWTPYESAQWCPLAYNHSLGCTFGDIFSGSTLGPWPMKSVRFKNKNMMIYHRSKKYQMLFPGSNEIGVQSSSIFVTWMILDGGTPSHHPFFLGIFHDKPSSWAPTSSQVIRALGRYTPQSAELNGRMGGQRASVNVGRPREDPTLRQSWNFEMARKGGFHWGHPIAGWFRKESPKEKCMIWPNLPMNNGEKIWIRMIIVIYQLSMVIIMGLQTP